MNDIPIAIVVSPRDWAERLHRFVADHGGARVRARVLEAREALEEEFRVLVAEDLTSFLTPRLVAELHRRRRRVLGVFEPDEPWGRERLSQLGVDEVIAADAAPEDVVRAIQALAAPLDLEMEFSELVDPEEPDPPMDDERGVRGRLVAVGGPVGGTGVSEVAIALTLAARRRGAQAVLVDADTVAPSLAQRLQLPLHPNVLTAVDRIEQRRGPVVDTLVRTADGAIEALCGLAHGRDRHLLRSDQLVLVLDALAGVRDPVVVDVDHDVSAGPDVDRPSVAPAVLASADAVVAVGAPSPVGVARLLDWLADVRVIASHAPLHVVIDRAPRSTFRRGELQEEIVRSIGPATLAFAPDDGRVADASWDGHVVGRGPFTRCIQRVEAAMATARQAAPVMAAPTRGVTSGVTT